MPGAPKLGRAAYELRERKANFFNYLSLKRVRGYRSERDLYLRGGRAH